MSIFNTCCITTGHRKWWLSRKSDMCHCVTIISEKNVDLSKLPRKATNEQVGGFNYICSTAKYEKSP